MSIKKKGVREKLWEAARYENGSQLRNVEPRGTLDAGNVKGSTQTTSRSRRSQGVQILEGRKEVFLFRA